MLADARTETYTEEAEIYTKEAKKDGANMAPPCQPPDNLNISAWKKYEQHRRDIKARKLKPKSVQELMKWLADQGNDEIQQTIVDNTTRNGYTGLFELKNGGRHEATSRALSAVEIVERKNKVGKYAEREPIDITPDR